MRKKIARLIVLMIVLLVAWAGYLYLRGPRLKPVTRRLLPVGYEVLFTHDQCYPAMEAKRSGEDSDAVWLDPLCRPIPGTEVHTYECTTYSPGLCVLADAMPLAGERSVSDHSLILTWSDGKRTDITPIPFAHHSDVLNEISGLSDNGTFSDDDGRMYTSHGKPLVLPSDGQRYVVASIGCNDPSLLPLWGVPIRPSAAHPPVPVTMENAESISLYDAQRKRMTFSFNFYGKDYPPDAILTHNNRFAYLAYNNAGSIARIIEGKRQIATFSGPGLYGFDYSWHWGEDGSVWWLNGDTLHIIRWQQGIPKTCAFPRHPNVDTRFLNGASELQGGSEWAAVWGDGKLVAIAETVPLVPPQVSRMAQRIADKLRPGKQLPSENRRLTLYRDGRKAGTFTTRLHSLPRNESYYEHLAFSHDGQYLSWVIDAGLGWQVYVFRVG